jgi:hypothetical protein
MTMDCDGVFPVHDGFAIVKNAIQVAPRSRKGIIPPEHVFELRATTSLLPVIADTGPQKEELCLVSYLRNPISHF